MKVEPRFQDALSIHDQIRAAVVAERERNAALCEQQADEAVEKWGADAGVPVAMSLRACAAMIRRG